MRYFTDCEELGKKVRPTATPACCLLPLSLSVSLPLPLSLPLCLCLPLLLCLFAVSFCCACAEASVQVLEDWGSVLLAQGWSTAATLSPKDAELECWWSATELHRERQVRCFSTAAIASTSPSVSLPSLAVATASCAAVVSAEPE